MVEAVPLRADKRNRNITTTTLRYSFLPRTAVGTFTRQLQRRPRAAGRDSQRTAKKKKAKYTHLSLVLDVEVAQLVRVLGRSNDAQPLTKTVLLQELRDTCENKCA